MDACDVVRLILNRVLSPTLISCVVNPIKLKANTELAEGTPLRTNLPFASVIVPIEVASTATVAPTKACPLTSVTLPETEICARTLKQIHNKQESIKNNFFFILFEI
jgi:hypothetical protein